MDIIYTDAKGVDAGILTPSSADFAYGSSENDFAIELVNSDIPELGALVYVEDTDIGGIVLGYEQSTNSRQVSVKGLTWTGLIDSAVLSPNAGQDYYSVSGDVRDCVETLIAKLGMSSIFSVDTPKMGVSISHTFKGNRTDATQSDAGRYMTGWTAMWQLLSDHGCKVKLRWDASIKKVAMRVLPQKFYIDDESSEVKSAIVNTKTNVPCTHLVCLGKGELSSRARTDLYLHKDGQVRSYRDTSWPVEITNIYENTQDELQALVLDGTDKLKNLAQSATNVEVSASENVTFDLGDVIGASNVSGGISAEATITKKIAQINSGKLSFEYTTTLKGFSRANY